MAELAQLKRSANASVTYKFNSPVTTSGTTASSFPSSTYYDSALTYEPAEVFKSALIPLERAPIDQRIFARQAQFIASAESAEAITVEGYDSVSDSLILNSGNWPLSVETMKKISVAALYNRVKYRLQSRFV
jgi:hypothetical protein